MEVYGRNIDAVQFAVMLGGIAAALARGDAAAIHTASATAASATAANAAANNYLSHSDVVSLRRLVDACKTQCTPNQREQLADLIAQDSATTAAFNACAGRQETACQAIRADYAAVAASFLPTDNDIWSWARTQATASNGTYTAAQIYDAYRTSFITGSVPNMSVGDLTQAAELMRGCIVGDGTAANPGEGPLSVIAMGWAVGNNASAQGALSAGLLALAGTVRVTTLAVGASTAAVFSPEVLAEQQRIRLQDIANQFNDKSIAPADMTLRLGGKTLMADPTVSKNAPVFIGATDAEIAGYFRQIAGVNSMPVPSASALAQGKLVYSLRITSGKYAGATITMRDYSSSAEATGAKWTIDIKGNPAGIGANKVEIKFR